ncbi:hypothetical protein N7539_004744 [Penicillium diatomitis]|uniref:Uncharacterized protein n=1 Tax=Penicillium diatomitis TaxID=2819901 RepID=A0A9X0BUE8_9EURO|nr:uncharacterized protein N7539_004744 [Penicillium diatomitis]KAJ5484756.1 hypothetical protein N7539_004744 [Penicillium diatomitis]
MASNIAKRKQSGPQGLSASTGAARKRAKTFDARTLAAQSTDAALSATGELDVAAYAAARAFEIQALEDGMQRSKNALTTRAFQKVPRALRRRTASHNVKRVPRRLRARAQREMVEDNTPTVTARRRKPSQLMRIRLEAARRLQNLNAKSKSRRSATRAKSDQANGDMETREDSHAFKIAPRVPKIKKGKLSRPPPPDSKFRKRQRCKTWLPTHMYHAKRAHMATSKDPIWRFAIPISPTEKSYRPTHRAQGARGAVAWDMSYMSTVQLEGEESGIESVLRAIGVVGDEAWGTKGKKWRAGTRSLQTWAFEKGQSTNPVAPITLVWCVQAKDEDTEMLDAEKPPPPRKPLRRKLFIRVHPSAFLQLWTDLLGISKQQSPPVMIEDLRFEIGSIEITGPGSTEALLATLQPILRSEETSAQTPEATWQSLHGVSNPSSLPNNALLSFSVTDPRLRFPTPTLKTHMNNLASLLAAWTPDQTQGPSLLFDRPSRLAAIRQLPSQKAINRRRTVAGPGKPLPAQPTDPSIPVMILASRPQARAKRSSAPGSWTLLLPWNCVVPVWYSLMFYPLSSGGNPRLGGLKEQQQLAFEAGQPWFPGDFPGTRAGWEWCQRESEISRRQWERRPKGRRAEFDSLVIAAGHSKGEIGHGWACDWQRLVVGSSQHVTDPVDAEKQTAAASSSVPPLGIRNIRIVTGETNAVLASLAKTKIEPSTLATVHLTLINRGTPVPCARIYRLPTDPVLRKRWLDLAKSSKTTGNANERTHEPQRASLSKEEAQRRLAETLISAADSYEPRTDHCDCPAEEDLIGFVTSGNFNLSEGKGTGIGSILLSKVIAPAQKPGERRMCIVRTAGEKVGRLGTWEIV